MDNYPPFDLELEEIFDEHDLSDSERKAVNSKVMTNFRVKLNEIVKTYKSEVNQAFPNQKINLEDKSLWKELIEKVPHIHEDLNIYIENELPELISECITKIKVQ